MSKYETTTTTLTLFYANDVYVERKKIVTGIMSIKVLWQLLIHVYSIIMSLKSMGVPLTQFAIIYKLDVSNEGPRRVVSELDFNVRRSQFVALCTFRAA